LGYKVVIIGKDEGLKMDIPIFEIELDTYEEALRQLELLVPNVYSFDEIRSVHIDKVH